MQFKIQQRGNNSAIHQPATVLTQMSLVIGDVPVLDVLAEPVTLRLGAKLRYRLAELMAQYDLTALEPAEVAA